MSYLGQAFSRDKKSVLVYFDFNFKKHIFLKYLKETEVNLFFKFSPIEWILPFFKYVIKDIILMRQALFA
jgi:hypothetical protein